MLVSTNNNMCLFGYDQGVFGKPIAPFHCSALIVIGGVNVTQDYLTTMGLTETSTLLSTITAIYGSPNSLSVQRAVKLIPSQISDRFSEPSRPSI